MSSYVRKAVGRSALALLAVLAVACSLAPAGHAFGIELFRGGLFDSSGERVSQAGAHPDLNFELEFRKTGPGTLEGQLRDSDTALPAGLVGNPQVAAECDPSDVADFTFPRCPEESQVGVALVKFANRGTPTGQFASYPVYNVEAPYGLSARFAFNVAGVVTNFDPMVRTGDDHGITVRVTDASQATAISDAKVTIWGVPADPVHDSQRWNARSPSNPYPTPPAVSAAPRLPLMTSPTSCSGDPLEFVMTARGWEDPTWVSAAFDTDSQGFPIVMEGCDRLGFEPRMAFRPSTSAPDSPAGLSVELSSPQNLDSPDGFANAHLRDVSVTLPEGLTINPGSAGGLEACSDEQLGIDDDRAPTCPDASKVGTATVTTPLLEKPLEGSVFVRAQASDDPESGEMFRIALVIDSAERGVRVKLAGSLKLDERTGRITSDFVDNPQLPVEKIALVFKSGPRAPLATPAACGEKSFGTRLVSWAGHDRSLISGYGVDCTPGLGGFDPSFDAGSLDARAGRFAPFTATLRKPDRDAAIDGLSVETPAGVLASLRGNMGSQVGSVTAFSGPGASPFALPGRLFLEGPYGDAPLSLRAIVPAKAGPFDLGEVVVRQKVYVDPETAKVRVVSDPLPTIVKGVPVRLQRLDVNVDKPQFTINPTSCASKRVGATLAAVGGQSADRSAPYAVTNCAALGFAPKLAMRLSGRKQTRTGGHPRLTATLTQRAADANIEAARVTLPKSLALDAVNAYDPKLVCDYDAAQQAACPATSVIGRATADSPLLNRPLAGDVHLVQGIKFGRSGNRIRSLPTLLVELRGEIAINLRSATKVDSSSRLVSIFANVPDARVSRFALSIDGGAKGILAVTRTRKAKINICAAKQTALVQTDAHNARRADYRITVKTPCKSAAKAVKRKPSKRRPTRRG